jgi:hypothetical protein
MIDLEVVASETEFLEGVDSGVMGDSDGISRTTEVLEVINSGVTSDSDGVSSTCEMELLEIGDSGVTSDSDGVSSIMMEVLEDASSISSLGSLGVKLWVGGIWRSHAGGSKPLLSTKSLYS